MVVDVGFPPVLLVRVPVGNVHVFESRMVVLVSMGGEQMTPVLPLMQVVGDVVMLVSMLHGFVLVMAPAPLPSRSPSLRTAHERGAERTSGEKRPQTPSSWLPPDHRSGRPGAGARPVHEAPTRPRTAR